MKFFLRSVFFASLFVISAGSALAQDDPYASRGAEAEAAANDLIQHMQLNGLSLASPAVNGMAWTARADFGDPRTNSGIEGATANVIGNIIYVSHGYRAGDSVLLSAYDIDSDSWIHGGAELPDAPGPLHSEMAGATVDGIHYAIGGRGGNSLVAFDTVSGSWATLATMPQGARANMGAAVVNGLIYVPGGAGGGGPLGTPVATHEVYDPDTNSWSSLAPVPTPVSDSYATVAWQGEVYMFGGYDGANHSSVVQIYDPLTDSWRSGASMPTARSNAMAGVCDNQLVVFGGYDGSNLSTTEIYDPVTDSWTAGPDMPVPVSEIGQGMVSTENTVWSIGSGIFGASGMTVQSLDCTPSSPVPVMDNLSLALLVFLMFALGLLFFQRRLRAS